MFPIFKIVFLILQGMPSAVLNPFFWAVIFMVWLQCDRAAKMEIKMHGISKMKPHEKLLRSMFFGILGGFIGSIVVILFGVSITGTGLLYVWPLALLLMLIHPHLMCFSYAGGLISLASLIVGYPKIDVAGLMALIAVLHLVESILIYFCGYSNASPVFVRDKRYGVIGGFSLLEYWPVPIMLLTVIVGSLPTDSLVQMPDWWPLIRPAEQVLDNPQAIFMMIPVVAALGYGDIALSMTPKARCKSSAVRLMCFSGVLLFISVMASRYKIFSFLAAAFAPAAHEALIIIGKNQEKRNTPLFRPPMQGEMILDVVKGSAAEKMGLATGDVILSVNGKEILNDDDLNAVLSEYPTYIWLTFRNMKGQIKTAEINAYPDGINSIGAILVPRKENKVWLEVKEVNILNKIKQLIRKKQ
jgi:hypothetical protein